MKKIRKTLAAILAAASLMMLLAGCGKFTCDLCGDEKSGKKYTEELFGMEIVYCKDCHKGLKDLEDLLG